MAEANEIRISSSLTSIQDVEQSAGGQNYNLLELDKVAGRNFGGKYNTLTAYTDADIAVWENVVISATTLDGLDNNDWTEAAAVTRGTLPSTVYAVAIEYVGELGTVGDIDLAIMKNGGSDVITLVQLDLGEGQVIPLHEGIPIANVRIKAAAYSNGVNEATVNILVLGV